MFYFFKHPLIYRRYNTNQKEVFLTFDDGPCPFLTPLILDLLKKENAVASFFVIGTRARKNPELLQRILTEGHQVFSHSLDHDYRNYFKSQTTLETWLRVSLDDLMDQTNLPQNLFRPPAGVLTPPLIKAAQALNIPLILWNHRFFDTILPWNQARAGQCLKKLKAGDIILLHDWQKPNHRDIFLKTLTHFLQDLSRAGFRCSSLPKNLR